jgi:hypothetical protein
MSLEKRIKIIFVTLISLLLGNLIVLADSTLYTIKVANQLNVPVAGVQIYGNHDFSNLGGAITGSDGKFLFDLRDVDRKGSSEGQFLYFVHDGYILEPSELEVNSINCPRRVCSIKASLNLEEQKSLIKLTFVGVNNNPIPDINVAVSDSSNLCGLKTDGYGSGYFTTRKRTACNDADSDLTNDTNKIMLISPKGFQCNFSNVASAICANKTINQLATKVTCSALNLTNTSTNYTIRARTRNDLPLTNVTFKILPISPDKSPFDVVTNSTGTISIPFSQVGGINPEFYAIPKGPYEFYPKALKVNSNSCPGRICHFYGAKSISSQEIATINVSEKNFPKLGTEVKFNDPQSCNNNFSSFTDSSGTAYLPVQTKRVCNENTLTDIKVEHSQCKFTHSSNTPFKFCSQGNTKISLQASCGATLNEHTIFGKILDPYGYPLGGKTVVHGERILTKSASDGTFQFKVKDNEQLTLAVNTSEYIIDPKYIVLKHVNSDKEIIFRAVTGVDGMPEEREGNLCEVSDEYTISGTVFNREGKGVSGVTILNNHEPIATTDASGTYTFKVDAYDDVWVTAEYGEELFNPAGLAYPAIACDHIQTNFQITGTPSFMQAGTVYDNFNQPIPDFELSLLVDGRHRSDLKTDSAGYFRVMLLEDTPFVITSADNRYVCTPKEISGVSEGDQTDLDFICIRDNCPGADKLEPGVCGCSVPDVDRDNDGKFDCEDQCADDTNKVIPGICGCGVSDVDTDKDGTADCNEVCSSDPLKTNPGICGCGIKDIDSDNDSHPDCKETCPEDPLKKEPLICGCGIKETDSDNDGYPDCIDFCKDDPNKTDQEQCGCGLPDVDSDSDGTSDCIDQCKEDPKKKLPGVCGCGVSDGDSDEDGTADCYEECPKDNLKTKPGICGCGIPDTDSDNDKTPDCNEKCPSDPKKLLPGICGCGVLDIDSDNDGTPDCNDKCIFDPLKVELGACGCGIADIDSDKDGTPNCIDLCPTDPKKVSAGQCGCGNSDLDSDNDGIADCKDLCPKDVNKTEPGLCGCGIAGETDSDGDRIIDCKESCDQDRNKTEAGICGCGTSDVDSDKDGMVDCNDSCLNDPLKTSPGLCGCGIPDTDTDKDGKEDCNDQCPTDPLKISPGACGCGNSDMDSDGDGTADCKDLCPSDFSKVNPGQCGCGKLDTDSDSDGVANCVDSCPSDKDKSSNPGVCGCGVPDIDSDNDGILDCKDVCPNDSKKSNSAGVCGCGIDDIDSDLDVVFDCKDSCSKDRNKTDPGLCGCGVSDVDTDKDSKPDCVDECSLDPNKIVRGACGCGKADIDSNKNNLMDCIEEKLSIIDVCIAPEDKAEEKVTLCHKESKKDHHTITIAKSAVQAHLDHGDELGNCEDSLKTQSVGTRSNNKVKICHIPPGNPENAHTIEISQSAVKAHTAHGDTMGECPNDSTGDRLRWKIINPNTAKYSGNVSIVNSSPNQNIQFQIDKNTSAIITSKKIIGQNTAKLIVDGVEHSVATHRLLECPKDLPKATIVNYCIETENNNKLKWKIINTGNIKFKGLAKILNSNPLQSQNIELAPNQEIEILTSRIEGVNQLSITVNDEEISKSNHTLVSCPKQMPTASIHTSCIDTINFEDQRLKWTIKNTSSIKLEGIAKVLNSSPEQSFSLNLSPNEEIQIVSDQIDGTNSLAILVDNNEINRTTHPLNECVEANLVLSGSIKGVNGRTLSDPMKKQLERFPITLKLRNNSKRITTSILLKDPYNWRVEVPRGDNIRIWLEAGDWVVASAPRVFRENPALISSNGYNFALRRRTLNMVTSRLRR